MLTIIVIISTFSILANVNPKKTSKVAASGKSPKPSKAGKSQKAAATKQKVKARTAGVRKPSKRGKSSAKSARLKNSSDSESEQELERVSLESLSVSSAESDKKKEKKKTAKKTISKDPVATPIPDAATLTEAPKKQGRPKSTVSAPRASKNKPGRPHRQSKAFIGSRLMTGSARKTFLETDADKIIYERSSFEPGKARRPRVNWTEEEIADLRRGVEKHGEGYWAAIHQDPSFKFSPSRTQIDLKDKWRNITAYVRYQHHPIRQFVLVNSLHSEILTPAGNSHIFKNRWPRDAALKVATRDEFYPLDENGKRVDSIVIYLKEVMDERGKSERPQYVHIYRGTRTLQKPRENITKFAGYAAIWKGKVEKIGEEILIKPHDILAPEEEAFRKYKRAMRQENNNE